MLRNSVVIAIGFVPVFPASAQAPPEFPGPASRPPSASTSRTVSTSTSPPYQPTSNTPPLGVPASPEGAETCMNVFGYWDHYECDSGTILRNNADEVFCPYFPNLQSGPPAPAQPSLEQPSPEQPALEQASPGQASVGRGQYCRQKCCLQLCSDFKCPGGFLHIEAANLTTCSSISCEQDEGMTQCCEVDLWHTTWSTPLWLVVLSVTSVMIRQVVRFASNRLSRHQKFRFIYFNIYLCWDACDQLFSWWFWLYASLAEATLEVLICSILPATLGTMMLAMALLVCMFAKTDHLFSMRKAQFVYAAGSAATDMIMIVAVFLFDIQGSSPGNWVQAANLVVTIIDFVLKVMDAAYNLVDAKKTYPQDAAAQTTPDAKDVAAQTLFEEAVAMTVATLTADICIGTDSIETDTDASLEKSTQTTEDLQPTACKWSTRCIGKETLGFMGFRACICQK